MWSGQVFLLVKDEIMSKPDLALPSSINDFCAALGVSFFLKEDISRYRNLLREPIAEKRASLAAELIQELTLREKERLEILSPCEEKRSQQFLSLVSNASSLAKLRGSLPIPSEGWGKKNISRAWSAYSSKAVGGRFRCGAEETMLCFRGCIQVLRCRIFGRARKKVLHYSA